MRVLITGGAGHVGAILRPQLEAVHECTYLDLRPVAGAESRTTIGSITDADTVRAALRDHDAAIQLVMAVSTDADDYISLAYDIHVKGMHVLLDAAAHEGVHRVIYGSTLSVYAECGQMYHESEDDPPDCAQPYGLTKRLGEDVCRAMARLHPELSVLAFRMSGPMNAQQWQELKAQGDPPVLGTGPVDLGRLYLAGLALENHRGFDAIQACSDLDQVRVNWAKAKRMLGWEPRAE